MIHKHHILPRHAGGTDHPDNIIELTIEEHADAHRVLYEEHGRWQDNVAYKCLSGQITNQEANILATKKANIGRKLSKEHIEKVRLAITGKTRTIEQRKNCSLRQEKNYIITRPNGEEVHITGLKRWCKENNLDSGNMMKVVTGKYKQHKGHLCRRGLTNGAR